MESRSRLKELIRETASSRCLKDTSFQASVFDPQKLLGSVPDTHDRNFSHFLTSDPTPEERKNNFKNDKMKRLLK